LYSIQFISNKVLHIKDLGVSEFTANKNDLVYLLGVMLFQNTYTMIKSIFLFELGVNLDLIISIILPIGTITVIIGLFIKNMMDSRVSGVLKAIKNIEGNIASFRVFYYTQKQDSLNDYTFVSMLPPMIKVPLTANKIDRTQAYELMQQLDDAIKFIETNYAHDEKQKHYMMYVLFNNTTCIEQINEIKANALKIKSSVSH
jgi:hypothetical protein